MTADSFARSLGGSQILGRCILNVASASCLVSDDASGVERTVASLDQAIVECGGRSLVVASEGSCISGTLIPVAARRDHITAEMRRETWREVREIIEQTLCHESVDLIHLHDADFHHYLPETDVPKLITLHLPPNRYPKSIFTNARSKNTFLHCVSQAHHRQCPESEALLSAITEDASIAEYLRRYEIIIRGCSAYVGTLV